MGSDLRKDRCEDGSDCQSKRCCLWYLHPESAKSQIPQQITSKQPVEVSFIWPKNVGSSCIHFITEQIKKDNPKLSKVAVSDLHKKERTTITVKDFNRENCDEMKLQLFSCLTDSEIFTLSSIQKAL